VIKINGVDIIETTSIGGFPFGAGALLDAACDRFLTGRGFNRGHWRQRIAREAQIRRQRAAAKRQRRKA